jgi:outer membrane lipoprotein carrier protein
MVLKKGVCFFILMMFVTCAQAAGQDDELQAFFNKLTSLKADFSQHVYGPRHELQQSTRGQMIVQRPGRFRWDYEQPYQQHIVADGDKVWFYDVDLEQVTIKPQDKTMDNTPATLLSDASQLEKQFDVLAVVREGRNWFELIPKQADSGFETLYIALNKGVIKQMELQDSFGQTTRIDFDNVVMNKHYGADTFKLNIPEGVDVIDETASR